MSGSIGIASEKVRKKEEGRSFKRRTSLIYMAVDISPTFTLDHTNRHDIKSAFKLPNAFE